MSAVETLRESLPEAARDLKIGIQSVLGAESLTPPQRWGVAVASGFAARNPALRDDWATGPDGSPDDFLAFARSEGRFAAHFGPDGAPSAEIVSTMADRLANWHTLQELAGLA